MCFITLEWSLCFRRQIWGRLLEFFFPLNCVCKVAVFGERGCKSLKVSWLLPIGQLPRLSRVNQRLLAITQMFIWRRRQTQCKGAMRCWIIRANRYRARKIAHRFFIVSFTEETGAAVRVGHPTVWIELYRFRSVSDRCVVIALG